MWNIGTFGFPISSAARARFTCIPVRRESSNADVGATELFVKKASTGGKYYFLSPGEQILFTFFQSVGILRQKLRCTLQRWPGPGRPYIRSEALGTLVIHFFNVYFPAFPYDLVTPASFGRRYTTRTWSKANRQ